LPFRNRDDAERRYGLACVPSGRLPTETGDIAFWLVDSATLDSARTEFGPRWYRVQFCVNCD
jgi:hypothetical protein